MFEFTKSGRRNGCSIYCESSTILASSVTSHCRNKGDHEYINKDHFSQFSPCLNLQNVRFRNPCRKVLPKLFYTRKHSNCSCESINFTSSVIVSSDHDAETCATSPLFRHSYVTAHLITEQNTVMGDPGFQNES